MKMMIQKHVAKVAVAAMTVMSLAGVAGASSAVYSENGDYQAAPAGIAVTRQVNFQSPVYSENGDYTATVNAKAPKAAVHHSHSAVYSENGDYQAAPAY